MINIVLFCLLTSGLSFPSKSLFESDSSNDSSSSIPLFKRDSYPFEYDPTTNCSLRIRSLATYDPISFSDPGHSWSYSVSYYISGGYKYITPMTIKEDGISCFITGRIKLTGTTTTTVQTIAPTTKPPVSTPTTTTPVSMPTTAAPVTFGTPPLWGVFISTNYNTLPPNPPFKLPATLPQPPNWQNAANSTTCLSSHNKERALRKLNPLVWDETLTKYALQYAIYSAVTYGNMSNSFQHSGMGYGENMAMQASMTMVNANGKCEISVNNWNAENTSFTGVYSGSYGADGKVVGHFTQVMWPTTQRVGCGTVLNPKSTLGTARVYSSAWTICTYWPPGNVRNGGNPQPLFPWP